MRYHVSAIANLEDNTELPYEFDCDDLNAVIVQIETETMDWTNGPWTSVVITVTKLITKK